MCGRGTSDSPDLVRAVVSRGGRPDLAGAALARVMAPTLLIGGDDDVVIGMNTLAVVARLATDSFTRHLTRR